MVKGTMIEGLDAQMVQARVNGIDAKPFLFGTYFPIKKVNGFSWKTLANQAASLNVAADIHADGATTLRKARPLFESARGDIPFISISRELGRSEIKEYQVALAMAQDADATKLVQYWGEDVDFCFKGVQYELEYIAWALASNAGKLSFTTTNNATFANQYDLDYDVYDFQKQKTSKDWGNASSADILGDLRRLVKLAKEKGLNPKFIFMNLDELYKVCSSEQIIKACSSFIANATGSAQTPDLEDVNKMLARQAWINGLQIRVIDQTVTREFNDKPSVSGNPFADSRIIISEKEVLGSTQYDLLQENVTEGVIRIERGHTVIKKYGTVEPLTEVTLGQADAIPVLDTAYRNIYVRTDAKNWD
nr:MAG TPA: Major capsid protein [Caudoviricetes sp.]